MMLSSYLASTGELIGSIAKQRRLLWALAKRDVSDEYVRHSFAATWAIIMPIFVMGVYMFVFLTVFPTRVKAPEGYETDAIVYLFAGIICWLTINQAVGRGLGSVVNNSNIVKQMAFPLELLPLKTLISPLIFMTISIALAMSWGLWITKGKIGLAYLAGVPPLLLLTVTTLAGLSLLFSALQVFLRDTKEFVTMYLNLGLFLHPILYLPEGIPTALKTVVMASPFTYLILCWQDVLFYGAFHRPYAWMIASVFATVLLVFSARVFMASKPHFGEAL